MKTLTAGQLNQRITLWEAVIIRDPNTGEERREYQKAATVWAYAEPISNRKIRTADQPQIIETWMVIVRPRKDVRVDWQIEWQGRRFTVRAVDRSQPNKTSITAEADTRND